MVGIVIVSHSKKLAHEIIELCNEMKKYDFPVINGSGTTGNHLVQVIMESLGGGGHQTMAAAQLKHITPQAARSRIQDAIDQYYLSQKKTTPEARPAKGE